MENFLQNIYGILFEPQKTIDRLIETKPVLQAFIILMILSLASAILSHKTGFDSTYDVLFFVANILAIFISSLIIWVTISGFFEVTARIFSDESHFKELLSLIGFALLPWILTAPLLLVKVNVPLIITSTILEIIVWAWSIALIFFSIKKVYNLSTAKTWLFFFMPVLGAIVTINWISQLVAIFTTIF
jgi:hypothetical protein